MHRVGRGFLGAWSPAGFPGWWCWIIYVVKCWVEFCPNLWPKTIMNEINTGLILIFNYLFSVLCYLFCYLSTKGVKRSLFSASLTIFCSFWGNCSRAGYSHLEETFMREKLQAGQNRFSVLLIFHFPLFLQFLPCSSMHLLTAFLLELYFYAHNIFTVSVTSACARATYSEKSMTTATGSWIVSGKFC